MVNSKLFNLPPDDEITWGITEDNYQQNLDAALTSNKQAGSESGLYTLLLNDPFIRSGYNSGITLGWTGELMDSLNAFYGYKIYYMTLTEAVDQIRGTIVSNQSELSNRLQFTKKQIFPNPFNLQTQIQFTLEKYSAAKH